MKRLKEFYKRIKKSRISYAIFRVSTSFLFVGILNPTIDFIVNDLIYNTPIPSYRGSSDFDLLSFLLNEGLLIIGFIGIFTVFLMDLVSRKKEER